MWQAFRPDVARFVQNGKLWIHPETGAQLTRCPWLRQSDATQSYSCAIYEFRPQDCRTYPASISEMANDGCEMLEPHDLRDTARAQRRLDLLLSDQRPALGSAIDQR